MLNPGVAGEVVFDTTDEKQSEAAVRETLAGAPIDVFVQPIDGRRKRLLIADMDSTMIRQECIDELAAELGLKDHIAAITERAMRGEIEFEPALRERVAPPEGTGDLRDRQPFSTRASSSCPAAGHSCRP